jgi:hypothetical protein
MQTSFSISQDLTQAEYTRFSLYLLFRMKTIRRLFVFIICLTLLATLMGVVAPGKNETPMLAGVKVLLPPVSMAVIFIVSTLLSSIYIYRTRPHLVKGVTYRFSPKGMERIGSKIEATVITRVAATIPWIDFLRIKESSSFFILHVRENKIENVHVIQKRMFGDAEKAEEFKKFVENNMPL